MNEFPTTALQSAGLIGPQPTSRGSLAKPFIQDSTMNETSDLKTKELEKSFLKAIDDHHAIIHKICNTWTRSRDDEKDLYQEIIYQLWKAYPSFRNESRMSTWIYRLSLRAAMLPIRRRDKISIEYRDVVPDLASDERPVDEGLPDKIVGVIKRLDPTDRSVLLLIMEGFTDLEAGSVLRLSREAVRKRLSRIRSVVDWYPNKLY